MSGYLDIIIFAVIAVVLLLRLRSVLGTRGEDEPQGLPPLNRTIDVTPTGRNDEAIPGQALVDQQPGAQERWAQYGPNFDVVDTATVHNNLSQFLAVDPAFRPIDFVSKAKKAFDLIVNAFAQGNRNTLELLLSPELYQSFVQQIDAREAARETYFIQMHGIKRAIISGAELHGTTARVTVDFTAEQSITHKDAEGRIINENDGHRRTTKDRWVFSKDLKDNGPTWVLADTLLGDD